MDLCAMPPPPPHRGLSVTTGKASGRQVFSEVPADADGSLEVVEAWSIPSGTPPSQPGAWRAGWCPTSERKLIHPTAWKRNSAKFTFPILYSPG